MREYGDEYGTQSLMNPYCVTTLVGGLRHSGTNTTSDWNSHLYDIRDQKRFYDTGGETGKNLVADADDFTTIANPTTTNIIKWSNKDLWGRTPYSFQDFVFCKWWNIIPNNRLITFRKYAVPTFDNLNFHGMLKEGGSPDTSKATAPIATVVTYFGGDSANKLSDFMKFSTGTKWKDVIADVHKVSGDTGSNPRAVIDSMFENSSGFGGQGSGSRIVNAFLSKTGGITGQYLSFGKFVGLLSPGGYFGHSQAAWEKLTASNVDPQDQIYSNRIIGPVNRIQSVKARDAGIEFSQSFTLVCEYVARPIGGINTKAAMLDILSNCLEIASPEASFWGGGYHFMIHPHMYPFKRDDMSGSIMDKLYEGKIFGMDGAIARGFKGLADFGKKDGSGEFSWSTVTSKLGEVLSQTVGAIGNMLQSVSSALFGESSSLSGWLKKGTDLMSSEDSQKAGMAKVDAMFGNLNKMWKDKVIQETTMPSISGMKAILTGEPTGNWHMTIGNPLNPIMVIGNLICTKMDIQFNEELGPDDFPLEMKVTYTIEHAMARDKQGIESMFNRGGGKIYRLPDYIKAVSDYETKVDNYTGRTSAYVTPKWMSSSQLMSMTGARGWQTYKINPGTALQNAGNPNTTFIPSFVPADPDMAYQTVMGQAAFLSDENMRSTFRANLYTRKRSNN